MNDETDTQTARRLVAKKKIERQITTRQAYRQLFLNDAGKLKPEAMLVMRDLSRFCYANKSSAKISPKTGQIDPYATHIADGRREVFLRLINQVNVDDSIFQRLLTQYYEETDL